MYDLSCVDVGKKIRECRIRKKMSLQALGEKVCKNKTTILKYENGCIIPDIITLLEICNALDIGLSQLIKYEEKKEYKNNTNTIKSLLNIDKLYLYYMSGNRIVMSILELEEENIVRMYNGFGDDKKYYKYYYEGNIEFDSNNIYMQLSTIKNIGRLEKVNIILNMPLDNDISNSYCFVTGITVQGRPVTKRGIIMDRRLENMEKQEIINKIKINKQDLKEISKNNFWTLKEKDCPKMVYLLA